MPWEVKCGLWSTKFRLALHCKVVVRRSCSWTTTAQQVRRKHACMGLAGARRKFYGWKRSYSITLSLRQFLPRLVRVLLVWCNTSRFTDRRHQAQAWFSPAKMLRELQWPPFQLGYHRFPPSFIPSSSGETTPLHRPLVSIKGKERLCVWLVYLGLPWFALCVLHWVADSCGVSRVFRSSACEPCFVRRCVAQHLGQWLHMLWAMQWHQMKAGFVWMPEPNFRPRPLCSVALHISKLLSTVTISQNKAAKMVQTW